LSPWGGNTGGVDVSGVSMSKQVESKPTIGCRILQAEMGQIDALISETGQSRSDWLYQLIREALGKTDIATVRAMAVRIEALEKKLARLAK
jgi:hypothetical protein